MCIGGVDTGDRTAIIHTMVGNIRQGGGDPYACPEDLFERLPAMTNQDDLTPLLPRHWLEARRKEAADREAASMPELRKFSRRCPASSPPRSRRAASSAYLQTHET